MGNGSNRTKEGSKTTQRISNINKHNSTEDRKQKNISARRIGKINKHNSLKVQVILTNITSQRVDDRKT